MRWTAFTVAVALGLLGCGGELSLADSGVDSGALCATDEECRDTLYCNGVERCLPGAPGADARGCAPAPAPACESGTVCDEATRRCRSGLADADGDGHDAIEHGGDDCDDTDPNRYPGNVEVCDALGHDEDCDPETLGVDGDADGDGYVSRGCCQRVGDGTRVCGDDCDDARSGIHPGATEVCNGIDDDCSGDIDDGGVQTTYYRDADGDGTGIGEVTVMACAPPEGFSIRSGDCDDENAARNPGAPEVCDGLDNDCDGDVDEGVRTLFYADDDGDGFGDAARTIFACSRPVGHADRFGDCDDDNPARNPGAPEVCDGIDNDCDGIVDDGASPANWYADEDRDGAGDPTDFVSSCVPIEGRVLNASDCDDGDASRNPAAPEVCDGVDNDCDGVVDDGVLRTFYRDADGDGFGTSAVTLPGAVVEACLRPAGYADNSRDCDDTQSGRNPAAPEVCDGLDNDCNGLLDYPGEDPDGDGHTVPACGGADCDNTRADVYPGAPELCDGRDNDCNGLLDAPGEDVDGDGRASVACGGDDCDDTRPTVFAGATERCDGLDNDCNGLFDGPGEDVDRDGFVSLLCGGDDCDDTRATAFPGAPELCNARDDDCSGAPAAGEDDDLDGVPDVACGGTDCDDTQPTVYPGAPERCDGLDNDCNGALDGLGEDDDRDGWADLICGAACIGRCGDCDDTRADVHPGAPELCDGRDNDCDGALSPLGEDDDQDGHADAVACAATCTAVCDDCDDTNELVHPGVAPPPDCNGIDDDCDGIADELEVRGGVHIPTGGSSPLDMLFTGSDHLVVHVDFNRGSQDLALTRVSADGQAITHPTTYLTSALTNEIRPDIDWVSPHVAMVYVSDDPDTPGAFYQRIDTSGAVLAGPVRVDGLGTTPVHHATVAVAAGADRALVVYSSTTGYYRAIIRPSDGGIVQAGTLFHPTGQFEKAWVDWDAVNGVFAAQLVEAQYSSSLYLYRFGLDGAPLGSRVVVDTETNTSHAMVADAGRFVSAWGKGTRRWIVDFDSATGAPLRAAQAVPIPVGHVDREMGIGLTPAHIHMTWEGGMTMRRRSDLGPVSGAYTGGVRSWLAHHIPWAEGRAMIIDAHTTLTIRAMRHVCY